MFKPKLTVNQSKLRAIREAVGSDKAFKRNVATAINKTQTKAQSIVAKKIGEELNAAQKDIKQRLPKGPKASATNLSTNIKVTAKGKDGEGRLPLSRFKPRQNKKGVSYKISRKQGSKKISGAFMGPTPTARKVSWKGNVFKRVGKSRLPIVKLYGVSPWGVYVKKNYDRSVRKQIRTELKKQINERLRFLRLKKSGAI